MKKARFTESQIVAILKQYDAGKTAETLCREHKISKATLYNWRKKYNGMDTQQLRKLKDLEDENKRLKRMFADLSLDHQLLKEVLEKKF
jgi:putative transposase